MLIQSASSRVLVDLLLTVSRQANVFTREIYTLDIAVHDGRIAAVGAAVCRDAVP